MEPKRRRISPITRAPLAHDPRCWGAQLQGTDGTLCTPEHVVSARHFKTKFCDNCKASITVPKERVRALSASMAIRLKNHRTVGMWSDASKPDGGNFRFRVINNTYGCSWPLLIVFEDEPPEHLEWMDVPPELQSDDGSVHLCISKGTLVPAQHVRASRSEGACANSLVAEPEPEPEPVPVPAPAPAPESPLCDSDEPVFQSKEARRMHRNRVSAAKSRQMKRQYIDSLERKVLELNNIADELRKENWYLRSLQFIGPNDEALRIDWDVIHAVEC